MIPKKVNPVSSPHIPKIPPKDAIWTVILEIGKVRFDKYMLKLVMLLAGYINTYQKIVLNNIYIYHGFKRWFYFAAILFCK